MERSSPSDRPALVRCGAILSVGFYKRRRGILEHIECGEIDLLESGIHDYLSLKANLLIGSPSSIPVGIVFTSAPAIHAHCKRVSERTIQRCLAHLEEIGWLKTFRSPNQRGNYPSLICRASVHDLSGNEYRINADATTDWRDPVYEAVGQVSPETSNVVGKVAGLREKRTREQRAEGKQTSAAAFAAIGFDKAFGQLKFKSIWLAKFKERGEWLTQAMEDTIQECQRKNVGVPPQFYAAKHDIEAVEAAEFDWKHHVVPL
jgi:hypothetical protein